jgi:DNA-binding transcriptional LysR family regulator
MSLAEQGLGLAYVFEPLVTEQLRTGRLRQVLEPFAPSVPGLYLYYPKRSERAGPLRFFIETLREVVSQRATVKPGARSR